MRIINRFLLIFALMLAAASGAFFIWANTPLAPMPEAISALQSDSDVQVTEDDWIVFQPANAPVDTGLILYPGGRVDPRAYAPAAREIAQRGYLVVIVPMPLNLAVINPNAALEVITAYPGIDNWVVGGHSLGGAMAARFVYQHPDAAQGLLLWAAYPASTDDLSGQTLNVVSIVGSLDGLGTDQGVTDTLALLPPSTRFITIEGGNHAQFGWYGEQPGDSKAAISRTNQQAQVYLATLELMAEVD